MNIIFIRKCPNSDNNPNCQIDLLYKKANSMKAAEKKGAKCKSCAFYGDNNPFKGRKHSDKTKALISQANSGYVTTPETRKKISDAVKGKCVGEKNGMFNKKHSEAARKSMSQSRKGKRFTEEHKNNLSASHTPEKRKERSDRVTGSGNPRYGQVLSEDLKQRISESVKKNPPPPSSGLKGMGGHYQEMHFRSSCELQWLLDNTDDCWVSAERLDCRIAYTSRTGKQRNYYPDWFNGKDELLEIKPPGWETSAYSPDALLKVEAAQKFCMEKGWKYSVVIVKCMKKKAVFGLRNHGIITLDPHWEKKYQKWIADGKGF